MMACLLASALVAAHGAQHTFQFVAPSGTSKVNLAGTFNNWSKDANPMKLGADGKTWSLSLDLGPGKHQYKFVVNGEQWIVDPNAKSFDDGNGNTNSLLVIFPPGYDVPARKGDGTITYQAIRHIQGLPALNWDRGQLTLTVQARPDDVQKVSVAVQKGTAKPATYAMRALGGDEFAVNYSVTVPWDRKSRLLYDFLFDDGGRGPGVFDQTGFWYQKEADGQDHRFVLDPATYRPFVPPSWVEKSFIYQIFPDRFANGDTTNDPKDVVAWNSPPTWYSFSGGDFAGVRQHLDYLKGLGANCVYFNPVFEGPSNHRYEATDYKKIDHRLGTNAEFAALTRDMDADGIKVVLDGVFNHTATDFYAFADILKNQRQSKYLDWYHVNSFPVEVKMPPPYEAWFGFASMPKLQHNNPAVREYLLSVADFWGKNSKIAGWRLDVPNELPFDFWPQFRQHVKSFGEDKWIVGEIWGDGSPWLKGDMFDSVMDYPFRSAVLDFVARGKSKPSEYWASLMEVHNRYGTQVSRNLMNLISSHDVPRILTECNGDGRLARLAAMLQFTWIGAPSVYYGDELGMEGGKDPDNRRGMRWDLVRSDNPFLKAYKALAALRSATPALQSGDPELVRADDGDRTLVFKRVLGSNWAVVVVNRSEADKTVDLPLTGTCQQWTVQNGQQAVDVQTSRLVPKGGQASVTVGPLSITVILPGPPAPRPKQLSLNSNPSIQPLGAHS